MKLRNSLSLTGLTSRMILAQCKCRKLKHQVQNFIGNSMKIHLCQLVSANKYLQISWLFASLVKSYLVSLFSVLYSSLIFISYYFPTYANLPLLKFPSSYLPVLDSISYLLTPFIDLIKYFPSIFVALYLLL